jgi:transposase
VQFEDKHAREIITPGKNFDGYWTGHHVAAQLKKTIPIAEKQHPGCILVFTFDNSSNHNCLPDDGLSISKMTLKPKDWPESRFRDGFFSVNGTRVAQRFYFDNGHFKGVKVILQERNLWPKGGLTLENAKALLASQEDFKQQRSKIEEVVANTQHAVDFFAKFHCETNFIERYWAWTKNEMRRRNPQQSFQVLQQHLPQILSSCPIEVIRNFSNRCWRYFAAYQTGQLSAALAEYAVKKYKSHRSIPKFVEKELEKLEAQYKSDQRVSIIQ